MIPVHCRVKHDPENGMYADCMRACVASILELEPEAVPHFTDGHPPADEVYAALDDFLSGMGLAAFGVAFPGSLSFGELLEHFGALNPNATYMLIGRNGEGDNHCVVCQGGVVAHDPAWFRSKMDGPSDEGFWYVMVLARR